MPKKNSRQNKKIKHRGAEIAKNPDNIIEESSVSWKVRSQSVVGLLYTVVLTTAGIVCGCPCSCGGRGICKHVVAVMCHISESWHVIGGATIKMPTGCPHCRSEHIVKNGHRKCKNRKVQRYVCRSCGHGFSGIPGFQGRHFAPHIITDALCDMARGVSTVTVCDNLDRRYKVGVHPATVLRWAQRYSGLVYGYQRHILRPQAWFMWHCDEIFFTVRGYGRYLFAVMDSKTRFVLSYDIHKNKHKTKYNPTGLFEDARDQAGRIPRILVTDGLPRFIKSAQKVFFRFGDPEFVHVREIHIQNHFNCNNKHERLNGEFADRFKVTRGLKSDDSALIKLMIIHHNLFRKHSGLDNMTPAKAAGIIIADDREWETVIANATLARL